MNLERQPGVRFLRTFSTVELRLFSEIRVHFTQPCMVKLSVGIIK